jgi:hypothetical protein
VGEGGDLVSLVALNNGAFLVELEQPLRKKKGV